jgi:hypothetical protein
MNISFYHKGIEQMFMNGNEAVSIRTIDMKASSNAYPAEDEPGMSRYESSTFTASSLKRQTKGTSR